MCLFPHQFLDLQIVCNKDEANRFLGRFMIVFILQRVTGLVN